MSVPARRASTPAPLRRPAPRPLAPRHAPPRTPTRTPVSRPAPNRQRRPAFHPGFLFFSTALVTFLVTGVVVLNVLLAQQAFQVRTLLGTITDLQAGQVALTEHVASLSAPGRVQAWASAHGMVTPPDVIVLPVPGTKSGGHA